MTPYLAKTWLEGHSNYRSLNSNTVKNYSAIMGRGEWVISQPIIFDDAGKISDGQHRLSAVIEHGNAIEFLVVYNVPRENTNTFDNGMVRTPKDVLGRFLDSDHKRIQTIINAINSGSISFGIGTKIYNCQVEELYNLFRDGIVFCLTHLSPHQRGKTIAPVYGAFGRARLSIGNNKIEELELCAKRFMSEMYVESRDVTILSLNKALKAYYGAGGGVVRSEIYKKTTRAIVGWMNNESLTRLYALDGNDPFEIA